MDEGVAGPASAPTDAEIAKLREFLGDHTAADSPGSHRVTGETPNNVRPLAARRERGVHEVD